MANTFREIDDALFDELSSSVQSGNNWAIIGPRKIGKSLTIEEVKDKLLKKTNNSLMIFSKDYQLDSHQTEKKILKDISQQLGTSPPNSYQFKTIALSLLIENKIREAIQIHKKNIIFLLKNIVELPVYLCREWLSALSKIHEDAELRDRVGSIVTGASDFLSLAQGQSSPFRFATRIALTSLSKKYFLNKAVKWFENTEVDKKTLDFIYDQTGGTAYLIKEIANLQLPIVFKERKKEKLKVGRKFTTENIVDGSFINRLNNNILIRMMLRDIEKKRHEFDLFVKIVKAKNRTINLKEHIATSRITDSEIPFLVATGVIKCDRDLNAKISSPILKRYFEKKVSNLYVSDIYCLQSRWDKAWDGYKKIKNKQNRPVSGEERFRLRDVLMMWENGMKKKTVGPSSDLIKHFINGANYILGFDNTYVVKIHSGRIVFSDTTKNVKIDSETKQEIFKHIKNFENEFKPIVDRLGETKIICYVPSEEFKDNCCLLALLRRSNPLHIFDTARYRGIKRYLDDFVESVKYSSNREYEQDFGKAVYAKNKVLNAINHIISEPPLKIWPLYQKVCEVLVKYYYSRAIICEIEPVSQQLNDCFEVVANGHQRVIDKNNNFINEEYQELINDVRQLKSIITENGMSLIDPSTDIIVAPLILGNVLFGILLLEKEGKKAYNADEKQIIIDFASQFTSIVRQSRRLLLLKNSLFSINDPILINDINDDAIFINESAAKILKRKSGWQVEKKNLSVHFNPKDKIFRKRLENIKTERNAIKNSKLETDHRLYFSHYDKFNMKSVDWSVSSFLNRKNKIVATVERFHDISTIFTLIDTIQESWKEYEPKNRITIFLQHLEIMGFRKARFYLYRKGYLKERLFSFCSVGLNNKNTKCFNSGTIVFDITQHRGSWACIRDNEPKIFVHDPNRTKDQDNYKERNRLGLPVIKTGRLSFKEILEKQPGDSWVDIPLKAGDKIIGKIAVENPKKLTPSNWQFLQLFSQIAGLSFYSAFRRFQLKEEQEILSLMLSHKMQGTFSSCEYALEQLRRNNLEKNTKNYHIQYLSSKLFRTTTIIQLMRSQNIGSLILENDSVVSIQYFTQYIEECLHFEITNLKDSLTILRNSWDCEFSLKIASNLEHKMIQCKKYLLLLAIENILLNTVEALADSRQSGKVTMTVSSHHQNLRFIIGSNGPPIDELVYENIQIILNSNGEIKNLAEQIIFVKQERISGEHEQLGLKLITWVIKKVHKSSIKIITKENETPFFQIDIKGVLI